ncbi:MAG: response regulator transcription factor [Betaproteobacteria bacterium]|jgi:DNA-binding response OmpR family regulator
MSASPAVLIVEDEESILLSLEFLLRNAGCAVDSARNGEAALAALSRPPPALVLLDVMLPGIDGYELCRRIRNDPRLQQTRVILLTARGRDADLQKGIDAGADAYLTKPFSTRELVAQVQALLARPRGGAQGSM